MGTIFVNNLKLRTIIGFNPEERKHKQDISISYRIDYNGSEAEASDEIEQALNYKEVNKAIISLVEGSSYNLLETLTNKVLSTISEYDKVDYAFVEIKKIGALRYTEYVSYALEYKNSKSLKKYIINIGSSILPEKNIDLAIKEISKKAHLVRQSDTLKTKPINDSESKFYLNTAILIETTKNLIELKKLLLKIESDLGRIRSSNKNAPRTIDLDITTIDNQVIDYDFYEKEFVKNLSLSLNKNLKY